jgi:hypothetical protein
VWFQRPERIRDREWLAQQFTQVVLLAAAEGGLGNSLNEAEQAHDGVAVVQA